MAVLDLEEIAGHRGSAFGAIGQKPKNQKSFDADLFARLESLRIESKAYVWMEAESKRIGRCTLPDFLVEAKENGVHVEVDASIPKRVERIIADYTTHSPSPQTFFDEVEDAVNRIKKKLSQSIRQQVFDALESRDYTSLVELLLVHYYDPQYSHSQQQYQGRFYRVDGEDLEQAAEQCINIQKSLENRTPLQIG
jgi:tRNA 2-selenouridine synthase